MKVYKLTTQNGKTCIDEDNETQWGEGIEHTASSKKAGECDRRPHAYYSPFAASLLNAMYDGIDNPICWECEADVDEDCGDILLCTRIKTLRVVESPKLTLDRRVDIAINAAMVVYDEPSWVTWAQNWLDGTNRSRKAAGDAWALAESALWESTNWVPATAATAGADAALGAVWLMRKEESTETPQDLVWQINWITAQAVRSTLHVMHYCSCRGDDYEGI